MNGDDLGSFSKSGTYSERSIDEASPAAGDTSSVGPSESTSAAIDGSAPSMSSGNVIRIPSDDGTDGVGASHPVRTRRVLAVAPTRTIASVPFNAVRPELTAIACCRMHDGRFDFDSSFVLPSIKRDLARLADLVKNNSNCPLSIFGHADPTGTVEYNKDLSGRRAQSVHAVLTRDIDTWVTLWRTPCGRDRWSDSHLRIILDTVPCQATGEPYLVASPGPGSTITNAVWLFQEENDLSPTGVADESTRRALFAVYMDWLCDGDRLKLSATDFLGGGLAGGKCAYQGCSERNPVLVFSRADDARFQAPELATERDAKNLSNRRVMIFLFRQGTKMTASDWPCPTVTERGNACQSQAWSDATRRLRPTEEERRYELTKDTFSCRFYDRMALRSPCEGMSPAQSLRLWLCDSQRKRIPFAVATISTERHVWPVTANAQGCILIVGSLPETLQVWWQAPPTALGSPKRPYGRLFFTNVTDDDAGDQRRLHNMGFDRVALESNVRDYQVHFGHPQTGVLADIRDELRQYHDHGTVPARTG